MFFCKELEMLKKLEDSRYLYEYFSAIRRLSYADGRGNGSMLSGTYPLNFCPECGRKVVKQINDIKTSS